MNPDIPQLPQNTLVIESSQKVLERPTFPLGKLETEAEAFSIRPYLAIAKRACRGFKAAARRSNGFVRPLKDVPKTPEVKLHPYKVIVKGSTIVNGEWPFTAANDDEAWIEAEKMASKYEKENDDHLYGVEVVNGDGGTI